MIRFINLTGQIFVDNDLEFTWYDTVRDEFLKYSGSVTWDSFESFEKSLMEDIVVTCQPPKVQKELLERFRALYPKN